MFVTITEPITELKGVLRMFGGLMGRVLQHEGSAGAGRGGAG